MYLRDAEAALGVDAVSGIRGLRSGALGLRRSVAAVSCCDVGEARGLLSLSGIQALQSVRA